jgi:cytosine/adenosine deaminase-related metal-dependent hydrolase
MPGLINAHTHLAYTALRNRLDDLPFFPWIRRLTEEKRNWDDAAVRSSTRLGILECLRAGITCVADLCDSEPALETVAQSPLRGVFYAEIFGVEKEQAEHSWQWLMTNFTRLSERYRSDRLQIGVSPHACYTVRPELYRKVAAWSVENGIPVSFHLAESREEEDFVAGRPGIMRQQLQQRTADWEFLGTTSIAHIEKTGILRARPLLAHVVQADENDLQILRSCNTPVVHCPKSNARFGQGVARVSRFLELGLTVALGTDSAASNNRLDLFEEGRFALLQQRQRVGFPGLTESTILRMWTVWGARALGLEQRTGALEVGKEADLIAVRVSASCNDSSQVVRHIVHSACPSDVCLVVIQGREVDLAGIDEEMARIQDAAIL